VIQHFLSLDTSVKLSFVRPPLISVIWSYCTAITASARSVCSIGRYFETPASRLIIMSYYAVFTRFYRRARYCYGTSSVRLPVTLRYRDHIGWKSSEIISDSVSLGCSLSADPQHLGPTPKGTPLNFDHSDPPLQTPTSRTYSKGNTLKFWPTMNSIEIAAEWLEIAQWSQKPASLFPMVRSMILQHPSVKCGPKCTPRDMSNFEWPYK